MCITKHRRIKQSRFLASEEPVPATTTCSLGLLLFYQQGGQRCEGGVGVGVDIVGFQHAPRAGFAQFGVCGLPVFSCEEVVDDARGGCAVLFGCDGGEVLRFEVEGVELSIPPAVVSYWSPEEGNDGGTQASRILVSSSVVKACTSGSL